MTVRVRFAPSPTGFMHVGNAIIAIRNWMYARSQGGLFLLRLDDTDTERGRAEYEQGIYDDLNWLGLTWDEFEQQSKRTDRYDLAIAALKASGRLYPCYETADELDMKRKIQLGQSKAPVYARDALKLSDEDRAKLEAEGRTPHWRFKLDDVAVAWHDLGRGDVRFEPGHLSDPVLIREDGRPLYTISSVVDDGELGITHVIRGEDHVANTAVQVQLFQALGFDVPTFAHMPLLVGADGKGLSKRFGSLSIKDIRNEGIEPLALVSYLTHMGASIAATGAESLSEMAAKFDLAAFGRASPRYEPSELNMLNVKVLHNKPFDEIKPQLEAIGLTGVSEPFWAAMHGNIEALEDAKHWWDVCAGDVTSTADAADADFLKQAANLLPDGDYDADTYSAWINQVKEVTGRKGKGLFLPLRLALTAKDKGPELKDLLPLMGAARAKARLGG